MAIKGLSCLFSEMVGIIVFYDRLAYGLKMAWLRICDGTKTLSVCNPDRIFVLQGKFFLSSKAFEFSYLSKGEKVSLILDWKTGTDSFEPYTKNKTDYFKKSMYSDVAITVSDIKSLFGVLMWAH